MTEQEARAESILKPLAKRHKAKTSVGYVEESYVEYWPAVKVVAGLLASRSPEAAPSGTDLQIPTPESDKYAEFEAWEQAMWIHQPVISAHDGGIAGCQCLDRVFVKGKEDWGSHLASIITARLRASQPVQVEVTTEMVERAARAAWEATMPGGFVAERWSDADEADREDARAQMRAALTAALGGGDHAE